MISPIRSNPMRGPGRQSALPGGGPLWRFDRGTAAPGAAGARAPGDRQRLAVARRAWCGVWLGCALAARRGEGWRGVTRSRALPAGPALPPGSPALLAAATVDVLAEHGQLEQQALAQRMAMCQGDNDQGPVAPGMIRVLERVARGEHWSRASRAVYAGRGCIDAGAAARVAPVGAWFSDDLERAAAQARRAAEITHAHPEGQAAAVGVAVAAGWCAGGGSAGAELIDAVLDLLPAGRVRRALAGIAGLEGGTPLDTVAAALRTLDVAPALRAAPLALWCAAYSSQPLLELIALADGSEFRGADMLAMVAGILAGTPERKDCSPNSRRSLQP